MNDMAEVGIDAEAVRGAERDTHAGGQRVVELSNGCICCTLREGPAAGACLHPERYTAVEHEQLPWRAWHTRKTWIAFLNVDERASGFTTDVLAHSCLLKVLCTLI